MRDNNKTMEFYQMIYDQDTEFIETSEARLKKIAELKGWDFENIPTCYMDIADNYYLRFYVGYTMGKNYEDLMNDARKYVENANLGWSGKNFEELVSICSFIILFNIEHKYIDKILKKAGERLNDCKYGEMFLKLVEPSFEVKADKTYYKDDKAIVEIITLSETDKTVAVQRLKKYVDKEWFRTLKEGLITNTSKRYHGYWCIEAAALVKALKLDDTLLKDSKYYPYDMTHFLDK